MDRSKTSNFLLLTSHLSLCLSASVVLSVMTTTAIEKDKQHLPGTFLIFLLFSSLHLGKLFFIDIGVKITPTDIVILVSLFLLLRVNKFRLKPDKYIVILIALFSASSLLEITDALIRDMPENITLGIAMLRNCALIVLVSQLAYDYKKLSRWIVFSGVFFSIVALIGYLIAALHLTAIAIDYKLWAPDIFILYDRLLRLTGLAGDPNIFFLVNLLPLILSTQIIREKKNALFILVFIVLLTASILTFSRTGIVILGLYFLLKVLWKGSVRKIISIIIIAIMLLAISDYILGYFHLSKPSAIFIPRFTSAIKNIRKDRAYIWRPAWEGFRESPVFGKGGRYTSKIVDTAIGAHEEVRYLLGPQNKILKRTIIVYPEGAKVIKLSSHNDYLEILSTHGIAGFSLMIIMYLYIMIFIKIRYKLFKENYVFTTGCQIFFLMLAAAFFHLIYYVPYIWFYVALIFSVMDKKNNNV